MASGKTSAVLLTLLLAATNAFGQKEEPALERTRDIALRIAAGSFPEIKAERLGFSVFESETNYFKARFSCARFLTFRRMRHRIYVNPEVYELGAPPEGIRAIIAHELAHVAYYTRLNRLELLGLARLVSKKWTAGFERRADLEAIRRGYGPGLIEYRRWLYRNIPPAKVAAKQRDYFTPEEIGLILELSKDRPELFDVWRRKTPRNINEIRESGA